MAVNYCIDSEHRTVFTNVTDTVDGNELYNHQHKLGDDPSFQPDMHELINCMNLQDAKLMSISLPRFVQGSPWGNGARRAIVVPNPKIFGLLHFFQVFMGTSHGKISIFNDVQSARDWLELH
jgi:hypothetical protein